jgi:urocanate hydratase
MSVNGIQQRALFSLTALYQIQPAWEGSVILTLGLDEVGAALAIAGNIAGAVTLAIDNDPARLREIVRTGACDFVVNTLDEAIRAMKNEVRKRSPLSVALAVDPLQALSEVLERGLAPQLFSCFVVAVDASSAQKQLITDASSHLAGLGAAHVNFADDMPTAVGEGVRTAASLIAPLLEQQRWTLHTLTFSTPAELRRFDERALSLLPPEDRLRRRWLEAAPRILQRQRPPQRSLWLTQDEAEALHSES